MSNKTTAILFVPGVGKSEKALKNATTMGKTLGYPFRIVEWQKNVESLVNKTRDLHQSYGAYSAKKSRKALYDVCCDATAYDQFKGGVMGRLWQDYQTFALDYDEVIIIAHSFGTVISYDFIKEHRTAKTIKFVTLGCPIPMFKFDSYYRLPGVHWINIWEKSDGVGHKLFKEGITNIKLQAGIKGLWLFSHFSYFKSPSCARRIKKELRI